MKTKIAKVVKKAISLAQVRDSLFQVFRDYRNHGHKQIGFVSGVITSDGPENIQSNIERLIKFTEHIKKQQTFPVFSAADVFDDALFKKIDAENIKYEDWIIFWREILAAEEKFITSVFMTPRWEKSTGATDEHNTAQKIGLAISYIDYEI